MTDTAAIDEYWQTVPDWREVDERYWRQHSENPRGYAPDMPVLCERFRLIHPR